METHDHRTCQTLSGFVRENTSLLRPFLLGREFNRNDVIYFLGERADEIFLLNRGRVKLTRISAEGKEKIIAIYEAGELFGELCLCEQGRRADQAVALESSSVTSFKWTALLRILEKHPDMTLTLLTLFCQRLSEAQRQIETLAFDNIPRRLAKEVLRLACEHGQAMPSAAQNTPNRSPGDGKGTQVEFGITHEELSQLVATSREIITTLMNQFRQQGLVQYTRRNLVVYPEKIQRFLEQTAL